MTAMTARSGGEKRDVSLATATELSPLQQLIQERMLERGWSYGAVARRGGLPRSTVHHLASTASPVRPPHPATLDGLARGLELPISVVRGAAAEAAGLKVGTVSVDPETAVLIAGLEELTADDRRHVAALVESLRRKPPGSSDA